jgi:hypothetical protein
MDGWMDGWVDTEETEWKQCAGGWRWMVSLSDAFFNDAMVDMTSSLSEGGYVCGSWLFYIPLLAMRVEKTGMLCFVLSFWIPTSALLAWSVLVWKGQVVWCLWSFVGLSWSEDCTWIYKRPMLCRYCVYVYWWLYGMIQDFHVTCTSLLRTVLVGVPALCARGTNIFLQHPSTSINIHPRQKSSSKSIDE